MLGSSITGLVTDRITVRRTPQTAPVDGIFIDNPPSSTFECDVCMQPAFGLNRVVGGADLHGEVDNMHTTDVRHFFTLTEIKTLSPGFEPDVIVGFEGADWTVARVEKWPDLDGGYYWHALITKQTRGAS